MKVRRENGIALCIVIVVNEKKQKFAIAHCPPPRVHLPQADLKNRRAVLGCCRGLTAKMADQKNGRSLNGRSGIGDTLAVESQTR